MTALKKSNAASKDYSVDVAFLSSNLLTWYQKNERPLPWRILWNKHSNPWHIWVSEIMLQQTVIKAVMPVYERFLRQYPSFESLAKSSTEDIRLAVRGLGYYRRFDSLHRACQLLSTQKQGLPRCHADWLKLPGVGDYTASAIASITLDEPTGVVDGNVERVMCRLLDIRLEPNLPTLKKQFKIIMNQLCAIQDPGQLNQAVMELGQTLCTPLSPACGKCPLKTICKSFAAASQHLAPMPKSKKPMNDIELKLDILQSGKKIVLFQRPDDAKFLKNTWGFRTSLNHHNKWRTDGTSKVVIPSSKNAQIGTVSHSITTHKITAKISHHETKDIKPCDGIRLLKIDEVEKNLVSNLDRKAWTLLLKSLEQ